MHWTSDPARFRRVVGTTALSIGDIAASAGVSRAAVRKLGVDGSGLAPSTVRKVAEALEVKPLEIARFEFEDAE